MRIKTKVIHSKPKSQVSDAEHATNVAKDVVNKLAILKPSLQNVAVAQILSDLNTRRKNSVEGALGTYKTLNEHYETFLKLTKTV